MSDAVDNGGSCDLGRRLTELPVRACGTASYTRFQAEVLP